MTREALTEMMTYDKLGSKEGPVPLLFLKFMIDMQEHTGMYNLITILGDEFYVSNEIDSEFKTEPEKIKILNNEATSRQWQIYILKP
jgi:hydroxymethylglutaryl-CoA reductase